jgi:hypothetical protein
MSAIVAWPTTAQQSASRESSETSVPNMSCGLAPSWSMPAGPLRRLLHGRGPGSSPMPVRPTRQHNKRLKTCAQTVAPQRIQGAPHHPPLPCSRMRCACTLACFCCLEDGRIIARRWAGRCRRRQTHGRKAEEALSALCLRTKLRNNLVRTCPPHSHPILPVETS